MLKKFYSEELSLKNFAQCLIWLAYSLTLFLLWCLITLTLLSLVLRGCSDILK